MVVKKFGVPSRLSTLQQIGYAIVCVFSRTFGSFRLHTPQLALKQIAWVLYGQASRAISIG
ncbi:transposase [Pseudomonas chlororaphis]